MVKFLKITNSKALATKTLILGSNKMSKNCFQKCTRMIFKPFEN